VDKHGTKTAWLDQIGLDVIAYISYAHMIGHRVVGITNGHSIHAGPQKGPEFLSIYLSIYLYAHMNNMNFKEIFFLTNDRINLHGQCFGGFGSPYVQNGPNQGLIPT
jgi:hypothetical protein